MWAFDTFIVKMKYLKTSTGNDCYSGDRYSGNDGYSGLDPPDDAILLTFVMDKIFGKFDKNDDFFASY